MLDKAKARERQKRYELNNPKLLGMCSNGACRRDRFLHTAECFKCWLGTKFDSMKQRTDNTNGHYPSWGGLPLGFARNEFVAWGLDNPPPLEMVIPSVDRIIDELGYVPGNIQWLERNENSRKGAIKQNGHIDYSISQ